MIDNEYYLQKHLDEEEAWLEKRPICNLCGEHIQEDHYFLLPVCHGIKACENCINDMKRFINNEV